MIKNVMSNISRYKCVEISITNISAKVETVIKPEVTALQAMTLSDNVTIINTLH